jgi:aspartyl-tRNA(Asn)/glutamyl-tRNA(Gln) amidotransferase subunit C
MPEPLSEQDVRRIARLARLDLTDDQVRDARHKLAAVVESFEALRGLDLAGVEPLTTVADTHSRMDPDVPGPTLPPAAVAGMAPDRFEDYVKIPKVLDGGGGGA